MITTPWVRPSRVSFTGDMNAFASGAWAFGHTRAMSEVEDAAGEIVPWSRVSGPYSWDGVAASGVAGSGSSRAEGSDPSGW